MADFTAPSSERAVAEIRKDDVRAHLMKFATYRCGSEDGAKDLLADAMLIVCDPARKPWDPGKRPFTRHMRLVIHDLVIDRARSGRGRFEVAHDGAALDQGTEHPAPSAEDELRSKRELEWMRTMAERTLARTEKTYPFARAVFDRLAQGRGKPAEWVQEIGCSLAQAYDTTEALKRHGKQVRDEWERSERDRMRALQQGAHEKGAMAS